MRRSKLCARMDFPAETVRVGRAAGKSPEPGSLLSSPSVVHPTILARCPCASFGPSQANPHDYDTKYLEPLDTFPEAAIPLIQ